MAKTSYNKAELTAMISEARGQIRDLLKSEDEMLAKGQVPAPGGPSESVHAVPPNGGDEKDPVGSIVKDEDGDDKGPPKESKGDDGSDSSGPPAPAEDTSAPPAGPPDASAAPAGAPPGGDPAMQDPSAAAGSAGGDPIETLKAAYAALPPEALKAHFMALKEVIASQMAAQASAAPAAPGAGAGMADPMAAAGGPPAPGGMPPAGGPPMGGPAAAPPSGPGAVAPMAGEGSQPVDPSAAMALKSEQLEAEVAELKKSLGQVSKAFELLMRKPERKAITGKSATLVKSEPAPVDVTQLSKSELSKKLAQVASNPSLKKSDRDLINGYFNHKVKVADLQSLFEKK